MSLQANTQHTEPSPRVLHMQHRLLEHPTVHSEVTATGSQGSHELSLPQFQAIRVAKVGITKHPWLTHRDYSPQSHAWFSKAVRTTAWSFFPSFLLTALFKIFWACKMIWNLGRRLRTSSYNSHKLWELLGSTPVLLVVGRSQMPKY